MRGVRQVGGIVPAFREAEIGELGEARRGDQDVGRLDVAMDDLVLVGVFQGAGDVEDDVDRIADLQFAGTVQKIVSARSINIFEHDIVQPGRRILADVVAADDIGMNKHRPVLAFELEAPENVGFGGLVRSQDLDRDLAVFLAVEREIDRPHAPLLRVGAGCGMAHLPRLVRVGAVDLQLRDARLIGVFVAHRIQTQAVGLLGREDAGLVQGVQEIDLLSAAMAVLDVRRIFSTWTGSMANQEIANRACRRLASSLSEDAGTCFPRGHYHYCNGVSAATQFVFTLNSRDINFWQAQGRGTPNPWDFERSQGFGVPHPGAWETSATASCQVWRSFVNIENTDSIYFPLRFADTEKGGMAKKSLYPAGPRGCAGQPDGDDVRLYDADVDGGGLARPVFHALFRPDVLLRPVSPPGLYSCARMNATFGPSSS